MIEVLNDFGLLKRIYVFWSKGDPVGPVTQSGTGTGASLHRTKKRLKRIKIELDELYRVYYLLFL